MEFILLRILKGRLSFRRDDLSLYIEEPDQDIMYNSMDIYNEAYDQAYSSGVMLKDELIEVLIENDMWSPLDDIELEKLKKENDELKVQAFKNFFRKRELNGIKFLLRDNEKKYSKIFYKKSQLDHLTCEGVASYARWNWIIEQTTYNKDGSKYEWNEIPVSTLTAFYEQSAISTSDFRAVARLDNWRSMWNLGKKAGNIFGKPSFQLTKDQLLLCSFSSMYDSVYEHPESPNDKIIEDDDCLDGWFIEQKRKSDKMKKEQQVNSSIGNQKIANAGEVFVVASSQEEAEAVHSMNTFTAEVNRKNRLATVQQKGIVQSDLEFADVRQEIMMQQNQSFANHLKGK